jgi:hypothetical protein
MDRGRRELLDIILAAPSNSVGRCYLNGSRKNITAIYRKRLSNPLCEMLEQLDSNMQSRRSIAFLGKECL